MNHPSPAIVAQSAVRPLPRWALWLLCLAYVIPGFFGRDPWRGEDMEAFGVMRALALGQTDWSAPLLSAIAPESDGLLPYWIGALAIEGLGGWFGMVYASRLPFVLLLALTLAASWRAIYHLARSPGAQPVAFAFGGEAQPADYARALADAGLLALIACLGLAQYAHEATHYLTQLCATALLLYAGSALPAARMAWPLAAAAAGLAMLVASGAPTLALLLGLGCAVLVRLSASTPSEHEAARRAARVLLALLGAAAVLAWALDLWQWRIAPAAGLLSNWRSLLRLLTWFTWPAWPLALWTLWRWRHLIAAHPWQRHLLLPLWFAGVALAATLSTRPADRALLLALPALAALAAFALPTLKRSLSALIDWFTLLFFSIAAIGIWVVWLAVQTGVPAKPAANVARLAPGYVNEFAPLPFVLALAATLAWCALVRWRSARHRAALWKSLILPAGGTTLAWLLLMTLWLPLLDYGRSYAPQVALAVRAIEQSKDASDTPDDACVINYGLSPSAVAALTYHGALTVATPLQVGLCRWVIADEAAFPPVAQALPPSQWRQVATAVRPTDRSDRWIVLRRVDAGQ